MSYISQSENNSPWNNAFTARDRTNLWTISIERKYPTSVQQVIEVISSQQLTGKFNMIHVITSRRDKEIIRTNIQEKRCIFNQIRHIQDIGKTLISLPTKPPTPDYIGDLFKSPLRYEWYDSIFSNYDKITTSTTSSTPF